LGGSLLPLGNLYLYRIVGIPAAEEVFMQISTQESIQREKKKKQPIKAKRGLLLFI